MVHGRQPLVFIAHEDIAGDPNWVTETLYRALHKIEAQGPLPPTLYLQLDNCFRENKNSYLVAYLCWLVERNAFKEIFVSFLPTGQYTHMHTTCSRKTYTHIQTNERTHAL